jgi:hypothetical protein
VSLLPSLAEAELISTAELLLDYQEADELVSLMGQMDLGCYRREGDTFWWIGSASPLLHDHERWLFRVSSNVIKRRSSFEGIMADLLDTCQRSSGEQLIPEFGDINGWVQNSAIALGLSYPLTDEQLATRLALFGNFGYVYESRLRALHAERLVWRPELHDLLHHPEVYLLQHPEAAGLSRELLLRMHGLGGYVDVLATGKDMLD